MAYSDVVEMAQSQSLLERVAAAAALEGVESPREWAINNAWALAATFDWVADWEYARKESTVNDNPDMGARDEVIDDAQILAGVKARIAELAGGTPA